MPTRPLETLEFFPPLRESIERLNRLCEDEEVDILAFAQTIESDPMLYSDILRSVNAPFYGFRSEITSIRHALTLFGVSKIHGLALQSSLSRYADEDLSAYGISLQRWLLTMRLQQEFLFHLLKSGDDPAAFIKLSGVMFVLEMGRLAANYLINETGRTHRFEYGTPDRLLEQEAALLGMNGDELAIRLFENWNFEAEFIELFRRSLNARSATSNQKLAATLQVTRTLITIYGLQPLETVHALIEEFGLNTSHIASAYRHISEELEKEPLYMECKS